MDIGTLAVAVMTAIATGIGTDLYDKGKQQARRVLDTVRARFARQNDGGGAAQVLQLYTDGNRSMEGVVRTTLESILHSDPTFAAQLLAILRDGPLQSLIVGEEATAQDIEMSNSAGVGAQMIQEGKKAHVEGVRMNITTPD